MCVKRPFASVKHARKAHRGAGYRIRVYACPDCRKWHVTASEKRRGRYDEHDFIIADDFLRGNR
jgi:ssDNA-binding Zn-finger/Zn-ribbon topoisomerase 1